MNKNLLLLTLLTVFFRLEIRAQEGNACPDPPPPGGESCQSSCVYCDFDGYMGINNGTPSGGNTVCGQIQIHNDQWFGFIAGTTSITIDIITSNCTQGNGLQSAFFNNCDDPDAIVCNPGCGGCGGSTFSLTYSDFTEGQTYWLMIDGWTGDVCDFEIDVVDGSVTPPPPDPALQPQGPQIVCPGATAVYTIPDVYGAGYYHWTAPAGSSINGGGSVANIDAPDGTQVTITFGNSGGNVCVQSGNSCNPLTQANCLPVMNKPIPPTIKPPIVICNNDLPYQWDEEPYPTLTAPGSFNLSSNPYDSYLGCDSVVKQTVIVKPPLITNLPNQYICEGTCFQLAGEEFCDPGQKSLVIPSFQGCDSLINFAITVLSPVAQIGGNSPITCATVGGLTLSALNFNPGSSFQWSNANWNIIGGASTVNVSLTGTYHLVVSSTGGGITCRDTAEVIVTGNTTPPGASASGTNINCVSTTATLHASSPTNPVNYVWTGPGISPSNQFLQDPVVNQMGVYTVTVTNPGNSCTSTATVTVAGDNTPPAASAIGGDITCTNPSFTINGSTNITGATWHWTGPGINPSNQSLEDPNVNQPGSYAVTVTNPVNGCTNTATATVNLDNTLPTASAGLDQTLTCSVPNITLQGSGNTGVAPMGVLWNGPNNFNSTSLTPVVSDSGLYILTITNQQNGCIKKDSVAIAANQTLPTAIAGADSTITCAQPGVILVGSASSTGPNFTPLWSGPGINGSNQNQYNPEVTVQGNYTLLITNTTSGCTATDAVLVNQDIAQPTADAGTDQLLTCTTQGGVVLSGAGTPVGVTFLWSGPGIGANNETQQSPTVTLQGSYTLVVTNPTNGCTQSDQVLVDQDANVPTAAAGPDFVLNCTVHTVDFDGSGSSVGGTFSYQWSGPGISGANVTAQSPTGITLPGTYNLTVTNSLNQCSNTDVLVVSEDIQAPTASAGAGLILNCFNNAIDTLDGSASSTGSIYTYLWSGPGITPSTQNLQNPVVNNQPGTYTLLVTNTDNTCTSTAQVTVVSDQTPPVADAGTDKTIDCVVLSTVIGGASSSGAGFSYIWTGPDITPANAGLATPTVSQPGTYNIVVTNNTNGCTQTDAIVVNTNAVYPAAEAGPDALLTCAVMDAVLDGSTSSNGPNFVIQWTGPDINAGNQSQTSPTVTLPGTYIIQITDNTNNCISKDTVVVDQDIVVPAASAGTDGHLDCQTTSITLDGSQSATGTNIQYQWTGPDITAGNGTLQSPSITQLGTYDLVVTNTDNGCTATDAVVITQDIAAPTANAGADKLITCSTTSLSIDGSGSSNGAQFTFVWQGPGINSGNFNIQSPMVSDSGTYIVTVTNIQNHCTATDLVFVDMDQEKPVTAAGPDRTLTCATTSVQLDGSLSQSGANFTYLWSGPAINPGDEDTTNPTVTAPGTYNLVVTNTANGCTNTDFASVSEDVLPPNAFAGNDLVITCANAAAGVTINSSGSSTGTGISYAWSGPGITANNATLANPTVLVAGTYTLVVTNAANGCTATDAMSVGLDNNLPTPSAGPDQILNCNILSVVLDASGSTSPSGALSYSWVGPGITPGNGTEVMPSVSQPGTYTVTVLNALTGCQASDQVVVTLDNATPTVTTTTDIITCQDPNGNIGATSSVPGSTFHWGGPGVPGNSQNNANLVVQVAGLYVVTVTATNGCTTTASVIVDIDDDVPNGTAEGATLNCFNNGATVVAGQVLNPPGSTFNWTGPGIGIVNALTANVTLPGTYTFTMTSPAGCKQQIQVNVVKDTDPPAVAATPTDMLDCSTLEVNINGGGTSVGPNFLYEWTTADGNILSGGNSLNPLVDEPGAYQLLVTNTLNGCKDSLTVNVLNDPAVPTAFDLSVRDIVCFGDTDGSIQVNGVQGGTEPFTFTITSLSGGTDNQYTGLSSGDYLLELSDGNGCHLDSTITIGEPGQLQLQLGPSIEIELGEEATVSAEIVHSTPLKETTWNWIPVEATCNDTTGGFCNEFSYVPLNSYRHSLTVIDENGCIAKDSVWIIVKKPRNVYVPNVFNPDSTDPYNSSVQIFMGPDVAKVQKWLIFDRWGEEVHEVKDVYRNDSASHAWNGRVKGDPGHVGVYVWYAVVEFIDGEVIEYKGDITLVR